MKITPLSASLLLALCSSGCLKHEEYVETKPTYQVTTPLKQTTVISKDYVCQIRAIQHIDVRALQDGYLENIHVDEGQFVKAGQLMFELMPRQYQAEVKKAEAAAQFAEIEYLNTMKLAETKVVAPTELALAKAKLDKAKALLGLAQVNLDFTQIKAPFDGIMGRFFARRGSLVDKGDLLTTLSDNSQMWVYFNVPEASYLEYKRAGINDAQRKVRLEMADHSAYPIEGAITAVEADFDNQTGNIAYRATFPNPDGLLRHGQTGKIWVDSNVDGAILIPQKAVFDLLDKHFVFVVDESGTVKSKEIAIVNALPDVYVVGGGLAPEERVLLEGQRKVHDGSVIDTDFQDPKKVFSGLSVYAE